MIIGINNEQEITFTAFGVDEIADNISTFAVDSVPAKEAGKVTCFNPETKEFFFKNRKPVNVEEAKARRAAYKARKEAEAKKAAALKWLADNDWKVNKYTLGEWSAGDTRWLDYLSGRSEARASIDEAEAILKSAT